MTLRSSRRRAARRALRSPRLVPPTGVSDDQLHGSRREAGTAPSARELFHTTRCPLAGVTGSGSPSGGAASRQPATKPSVVTHMSISSMPDAGVRLRDGRPGLATRARRRTEAANDTQQSARSVKCYARRPRPPAPGPRWTQRKRNPRPSAILPPDWGLLERRQSR